MLTIIELGIQGSYDTRESHPECVIPVRAEYDEYAATLDSFSARECIVSFNAPERYSPSYLRACGQRASIMEQNNYVSKVGVATMDCVASVADVCPLKCDNDSEIALHKAASSTVITKGQFQNQLVKNGPFPVRIKQYEDLKDYKGGVYRPQSTKVVGYLNLELIGYTNDAWILKGQFGEQWGEDGFLYLALGECEIDQITWSVLAEQ